MITPVGSIGTANEKVSDTQIDLVTTADAFVGDLVGVWVALDNPNLPTNALSDQLAVTDDSGNIYARLMESRNRQTAAEDAATAALYFCVLGSDLLTSGTISIVSATAVPAKAASAHRFTLDAAQVIATAREAMATGAADPDAVVISDVPVDAETLFAHVLAAEGPNTDTYTWDADYTQITGDGTTGGTVESNQHVRGGYRLATLGGDTVDVTSLTADRDYEQCLVAIQEFLPNAFDQVLMADGAPVAYWKFDDPADGPLADLIGNRYLGTLGSTPTFRDDGPPGQDFSVHMNGGQTFDRASQVTAVTDNFWISVWFYYEVITLNDQRLIYNGNPATNGWGIFCDSNGRFQFLAGNVAFGPLSAGVMSLNAWNQIVVQRVAGQWEYHLNGAVDTANAGTNTPNAPSGPFGIGDTSIQGRWARAAVGTTPLTSAQIAEQWDVGTPPAPDNFDNGVDIGNANSKASSTTVVITTTEDVEVGDLIVVGTAWDNTIAAGATGPVDLQLSCTDDVGNDYTVGGAAQNTGGGGTANGVHSGGFVAYSRAFMPAGSSITLTQLSTAQVAKAATATKFANNSTYFAIAARTFADNDGVDPSALSLAGLDPSYEYLFVHVLAGEGPNTDAYTPDADYTASAPDGTTGAGDASNMHVRMWWRVAKITEDTVDVTSTTADRDYSQVFFAIRQHELSPFPSTGLVDDFNRADEGPLNGGGIWNTAAYNNGTLNIVSNEVARTSAGIGAQVTTATEGGDHEVWAELDSLGTGHAALIAGASADNGATRDNYLTQINSDGLEYRLIRTTNGAEVVIGASTPANTAGTRHGIRVADAVVEAWVNENDGRGWRLVIPMVDGNFTSGRTGLQISNNSTYQWDSFGGGLTNTADTPPIVPIAIETDTALPLGDPEAGAGGQGGSTGAVEVPASPGEVVVTGLGFAPQWIFFCAVNAPADDDWFLGPSCMSKGIVALDQEGDIFQRMSALVFDHSGQVASHFDARAVVVEDARGVLYENTLFSADVTSLDADGFTLDFDVAATGYRVYWIAGENAAQGTDITFATAAGLVWDNVPNGALYVGLSDVASGSIPRSWNGTAATAQTGFGRLQPAADDVNTSAFIWWDPGYNGFHRYNQIGGPSVGWAGLTQDPWVFGTVIQHPFYMDRAGNDVAISGAFLSWVAGLVTIADTDVAAAVGDAHEDVGEEADVSWGDPDFKPVGSIHIGGNTKGLLGNDSAHVGASIGASVGTDEGWVCAVGTKMGFGAACYRSEQYHWISAWEPFDNPTDMTAGTARPVTNAVRLTTEVSDHATREMRVWAFGRAGGLVSMNWRYASRPGSVQRALFSDAPAPGS